MGIFFINRNQMAKNASVPENILKKEQRDTKLLALRKAQRDAAKKDRAAKRTAATANAKKYAEEYAKEDQGIIDAKRDAKSKGQYYVEAQAKIAFVIRTRGINKLSPKCKKIMQLLRLRQINNGVFVRLNRATINMIRTVEPYITYGYPSRDNVRRLIYKIWTVGPAFKEANNFLWPVKLNTPRHGWEKKRHPFCNGGVWGNREELINEVIARMN